MPTINDDSIFDRIPAHLFQDGDGAGQVEDESENEAIEAILLRMKEQLEAAGLKVDIHAMGEGPVTARDAAHMRILHTFMSEDEDTTIHTPYAHMIEEVGAEERSHWLDWGSFYNLTPTTRALGLFGQLPVLMTDRLADEVVRNHPWNAPVIEGYENRQTKELADLMQTFLLLSQLADQLGTNLIPPPNTWHNEMPFVARMVLPDGQIHTIDCRCYVDLRGVVLTLAEEVGTPYEEPHDDMESSHTE